MDCTCDGTHHAPRRFSREDNKKERTENNCENNKKEKTKTNLLGNGPDQNLIGDLKNEK